MGISGFTNTTAHSRDPNLEAISEDALASVPVKILSDLLDSLQSKRSNLSKRNYIIKNTCICYILCTQ